MNENIGKLTTPNNDGASIEVDSNLIKINNPLEFDSRGKIRYDPNQKWFAIQDHYPDGDLDKGPFILLADGDKYPDDHTNNYQNGTITLCARPNDESNKTTLSLIHREEKILALNNIINNVSTISVIDSILRQGNNFIQYTSGLLIQWGYINTINSNSNTIVTLPIEYLSENSYSIQLTRRSGDSTTTIYNLWVRAPYTSNTFNIYGDANTGCFWTTIGRWK